MDDAHPIPTQGSSMREWKGGKACYFDVSAAWGSTLPSAAARSVLERGHSVLDLGGVSESIAAPLLSADPSSTVDWSAEGGQ